jgi:TolA-binding protein
VIKKKSGVKVFQVKRYEGEPTMNPRDNPREIEAAPMEPPPKPIYPLFSVKNPEHRPETEVPDRGDQESYHLTTQDEDEIMKMQEEINRLDEQRIEQQLASSKHSESH